MNRRRQCIRIPNGILCTSGEPSQEDLKAVGEFVTHIRKARAMSLNPATPSVIIDPRGKGSAKVKVVQLGPSKVVWKFEGKNWALKWQRVHSGDPKRHIYRKALKIATGADRVADLAFTPSGLSISGKCSKVVNKAGLLKVMGYFQILAP